MNTEYETSESAYRIRAAVRVLLSSAVWLVVGIQAVSQLVLSVSTAPGVEGEQDPAMWRSVVFFASFMFVLYLFAGGFRAFTLGRDRVTVKQALTHAKAVIGDFLWLIVKASLLFALFLLLVLNLAVFITGFDEQKLVELIPNLIWPITHAISLVFVYWLPIVFATSTFRVFKTLAVALQIARQRLPSMGYPAFLILAPAVVLWLLPQGTPLPITLIVTSAANLMSWVAYVYCAEYVIRDRDAVMSLLLRNESGQP